MSATTQCPHSDLHFNLNNSGFGDTNLHYLEIKAECQTCGKPMIWRGVPMGSNPDAPACSVDGTELRLPFLGENEELVGKPIGFSVKMVAAP